MAPIFSGPTAAAPAPACAGAAASAAEEWALPVPWGEAAPGSVGALPAVFWAGRGGSGRARGALGATLAQPEVGGGAGFERGLQL